MLGSLFQLRQKEQIVLSKQKAITAQHSFSSRCLMVCTLILSGWVFPGLSQCWETSSPHIRVNLNQRTSLSQRLSDWSPRACRGRLPWTQHCPDLDSVTLLPPSSSLRKQSSVPLLSRAYPTLCRAWLRDSVTRILLPQGTPMVPSLRIAETRAYCIVQTCGQQSGMQVVYTGFSGSSLIIEHLGPDLGLQLAKDRRNRNENLGVGITERRENPPHWGGKATWITRVFYFCYLTHPHWGTSCSIACVLFQMCDAVLLQQENVLAV